MSILQKLPPLPIPRIARFLSVIAIAMAAGHLVQTLAARKPGVKMMATTSVPKDIVQLSAGSAAMPVIRVPQSVAPMDFITLVSAEAVQEQGKLAQPVEVATVPSCPVDLTLDAEAGAMIGLTLTAPCHAAERVVLRHAGLAVTVKLDADGVYATALPALVTDAKVEAMFADGNTVAGNVTVADAAALHRFGVQWQGADAFVVHGLEDGAEYGQPGDISPVNLGRSGGGTLIVLGDSSVEVPLLAQIYTFPSGTGLSAEVVIDAAVTRETCGHDMLGETISSSGNAVEITDLTLAMPDCSGIGDFLVLKNLASDMKIAAN